MSHGINNESDDLLYGVRIKFLLLFLASRWWHTKRCTNMCRGKRKEGKKKNEWNPNKHKRKIRVSTFLSSRINTSRVRPIKFTGCCPFSMGLSSIQYFVRALLAQLVNNKVRTDSLFIPFNPANQLMAQTIKFWLCKERRRAAGINLRVREQSVAYLFYRFLLELWKLIRTSPITVQAIFEQASNQH